MPPLSSVTCRSVASFHMGIRAMASSTGINVIFFSLGLRKNDWQSREYLSYFLTFLYNLLEVLLHMHGNLGWKRIGKLVHRETHRQVYKERGVSKKKSLSGSPGEKGRYLIPVKRTPLTMEINAMT